MPISRSILSYPDCKQAFERAIDAERGVKMTFKDVRAARRFAFRCNTFRGLDRKENAKIYESPTHSLHGRSIFDTIAIRVTTDDKGGGVVRLEKIATDVETEEI